MGSKQALVVVALLVAGCAPYRASFTGPDPAPRDVVSPSELSEELRRLRVVQPERDDLPVSEYQREHCGPLSRSERYLICLPDLGWTTLEIVDLTTGEHRVLVRKDEAFPGAVRLAHPSFTPDERAVILDVGWPDHFDPAIVEIESGQIEYIDAPGTTNWDPELSPDGRTILVRCERTQARAGLGLCLIDRQRRTRTHLVDEPIYVVLGSRFTPDGCSVVFTASTGVTDGEGRLYRLDLDDKEIHLLVSGLSSSDMVWDVTSADVVFSCTFPERPLCSWVCVVGLDGTDVRRLTYLGEHCIDIGDGSGGGP